jgi:hypothetical protein
VVVRQYLYARAQKEELERQCDIMLQNGVIRPNSMVFSVSVLLVRKSDGSWHFCVD